ncbi:hypothetical protein, conserved [Eimeria brunetti]|uniref:Uncharacterized protein n=1 Tax=Eimeria brunetti TaxID=51314 RepID=U6LW89_9EIME|nr:hypothetical protein, conserved [Eimeria brunetti]
MEETQTYGLSVEETETGLQPRMATTIIHEGADAAAAAAAAAAAFEKQQDPVNAGERGDVAKPPSSRRPALGGTLLGALLLAGAAAAAAAAAAGAAAASARSRAAAAAAAPQRVEVSARDLSELSQSVQQNLIELEDEWYSSSEETKTAFRCWYFPRKRGIVVSPDPLGEIREKVTLFSRLPVPAAAAPFQERRAYAVQCLLLNTIFKAAQLRLQQLEASFQRWTKDPSYPVPVLNLSGPLLVAAELNKAPAVVSFPAFTGWLANAGVGDTVSVAAADTHEETDKIPFSLAIRLKNQVIEETHGARADSDVFCLFRDFFAQVQGTLLAGDSPFKAEAEAAAAAAAAAGAGAGAATPAAAAAAAAAAADPLPEVPLLQYPPGTTFPLSLFKKAYKEAEETFQRRLSPEDIHSWGAMWDIAAVMGRLRKLGDRAIQRQVEAQKLMQKYVELTGMGRNEESLAFFEMALALF